MAEQIGLAFTMVVMEATGGFGEGDESEFEQAESELPMRALGRVILLGWASGGLGLQVSLPQVGPQ